MKKLLLLFSALTSVSSAYAKNKIYESHFLDQSKFYSHLKSSKTLNAESKKISPAKKRVSSTHTRRSRELNKLKNVGKKVRSLASSQSRKNHLLELRKNSKVRTHINNFKLDEKKKVSSLKETRKFRTVLEKMPKKLQIKNQFIANKPTISKEKVGIFSPVRSNLLKTIAPISSLPAAKAIYSATVTPSVSLINVPAAKTIYSATVTPNVSLANMPAATLGTVTPVTPVTSNVPLNFVASTPAKSAAVPSPIAPPVVINKHASSKISALAASFSLPPRLSTSKKPLVSSTPKPAATSSVKTSVSTAPVVTAVPFKMIDPSALNNRKILKPVSAKVVDKVELTEAQKARTNLKKSPEKVSVTPELTEAQKARINLRSRTERAEPAPIRTKSVPVKTEPTPVKTKPTSIYADASAVKNSERPAMNNGFNVSLFDKVKNTNLSNDDDDDIWKEEIELSSSEKAKIAAQLQAEQDRKRQDQEIFNLNKEKEQRYQDQQKIINQAKIAKEKAEAEAKAKEISKKINANKTTVTGNLLDAISNKTFTLKTTSADTATKKDNRTEAEKFLADQLAKRNASLNSSEDEDEDEEFDLD